MKVLQQKDVFNTHLFKKTRKGNYAPDQYQVVEVETLREILQDLIRQAHCAEYGTSCSGEHPIPSPCIMVLNVKEIEKRFGVLFK